jgi:hypothetical protein
MNNGQNAHIPRANNQVNRAPHIRFPAPREVVMETAYLVCAIVGGTLIACQFLLTMLGLGGHHDMGGDHDVGGHDAGGHDAGNHDASGHDADHDHHGHSSPTQWFLSVLTFRTITAGVGLFGLSGLFLTKCDVEQELALAGAAAVGLAALFAVGWAMRTMSQLNIDGTVHIRRAVGAAGTVYLSIPANKSGAGKVQVGVNGRLVEYRAITPETDLATGAKIVVVAVVNSETVEVVPAPSSERVSHE